MNNQIETSQNEMATIEEDESAEVAAERRGLEASVREAHAIAASYDATTGDLSLTLRGGTRVLVATQLLQGVAGAPANLIERVEIWGAGSALHWEELDADLLVQDIVAGSFGTRRWMAGLEKRGLLDAASVARNRQVGQLLNELQREQVQKAAAAMGRRGGAARTDSKIAAARANGAKGGRPRKSVSVAPN